MYSPGETLDPGCAPTDDNCGVVFDYITFGSLSSLISELNYDALTGVFSLEDGYVIPLASSIEHGNTAYSWGDHALEGYFSLPAYTPGSILFSDGATLAQNNANFFWDNLNNRLGIGTSTPTETFSLVGNMAMTGDIVPTENDTYALGSLTHVWKDLFVGAGSIYVNGQKVLQTDPTDSVVVSADDAQNLILKTTGGGNIELNSTSGGGSILLKSNVTLTAGKALRTSDLSPVIFSDGTQSGNVSIAGNIISSTVTNGGIEITPNGLGGTYFTHGNVGIGTTTGLSKLSINGGLHVGGDSDVGDNNIVADGTILGSNLSGTNTGDETSSSIKSKLGASTTSTDGYLTSTDWNIFSNKQPAGNYLTSLNGLDISDLNNDSNFVTNLSSFTTTDLTEGTKLYYTDARARNALSVSATGLSYSATTGDFALASGYIIPTQIQLDNKQDILSSGTNIKTINGNSVLGSGDLSIGSAQWGTVGSDIYYNAGKVGIGTITPGVKLTLQQADQAYAQPGLTSIWDMAFGIAANTDKISGMDFKNFNSAGQVRLMARNDQNDYLVVNMPGSTSGATFFGQTSNTVSTIFSQGVADTDKALAIGTYNAGSLILGTNNTERMRILSNGNVGIGTTAPASKLDINGLALTIGADVPGFTTRTNATDKAGIISVPHYTTSEENTMAFFGNSTATGNAVIFGGGSSLYNAATKVSFYTATNSTTLTGTEKMTINGNGDVGIGTTSPVAKLEVNAFGSAPSSALYTSDNIVITGNTNSAAGFNIISGGNDPFHRGVFKATRIRGTASSPTAIQSGDYTFSLLGAGFDGTGGISSAGINMLVDGTVSTGVIPQAITFQTTDTSASRTERMRISSSGNVGIGTTTPTSKLDIRGGVVLRVDEGEGAGFNSYRFNSLADTSPAFGLFRSRGTIASPLIVQNGDSLGYFAGRGYDGVNIAGNYPFAARIDFKVDGSTISSTSMPGSVSFSTTPSGTITPVERMIIKNNGNVGIGTVIPEAGLHISRNGDASNFQLIIDGTNSNSGSPESAFILRGSEGTTASPTAIQNGTTFAQWSAVGYGTNTFGPASQGRLKFIAEENFTNSTKATTIAFDTTPSGSTSGLERMRITGAGNVGIGTASPLTRLHLEQAGITSTREQLFRGTISDASGDQFFIGNGTIADGRFLPAFGGMVNSGNTGWSLAFNGFVSSTNDASDSSNYGLIDFVALRTSSTTDPSNGTLSDIVNRKAFTFRTLNNAFMTIGGTGLVNIGGGFTNPRYPFEVGLVSNELNTFLGTNLSAAFSSATRNLVVTENRGASSNFGGAFIGAYANDGAAMASGDRLGGFFFGGFNGATMVNASMIHAFTQENWTGASSGSSIVFATTQSGGTARTDKIWMTGSGNLSVGATSTPSARIHAISTAEQFRLGYDAFNYWNATTDLAGLTTFNAVGSGAKFVFSDQTQFSSVGSGAYAFDLNLTADGTLTTSASDERLKDNIASLDSVDTLNRIMQLDARSFQWKSNAAHDIGLVAQEVEGIFPELVFTNTTDGYKGINYSRLPTLLISALQEQQKQINALKSGGGISMDTLNSLVLSGTLEIVGQVDLGRDSVGQAVVQSGTTEVAIVFETSYTYQPVITLSKNTPGILGDYYVDDVTRNGFKIKIDTPQNKDFVFSWHAFGAKNLFQQPVPDTTPESEMPSCISPQILENNLCIDPQSPEENIPLAEETIVSETPDCTSPQILENNICIDPPPPEEETLPPPAEEIPPIPEILPAEPLPESVPSTP